MDVLVKRGSELSEKEIEQINNTWRGAWPDTDLLDSERREEFASETYFLAFSEDKIVSVGRLIPVELEFMGKTYMIEGIADMVSAHKGKGYGKKVMNEMVHYLEEKGETGIGFCSSRNSPFYMKCGLEIAKDKLGDFLYKHPDGNATKSEDPEDDDIVYKDGKDHLMDKVLTHPEEKVFIHREHW